MSDLRLRRSDLDAFERGIRRRNRLVWTSAVLLAAGGAAAAAWYLTRPPPVMTSEREPNDEPAQADRIAAGTPITGFLGKRHSQTEGDRDIYVLPGSGRRVVSIAVSGIPNLDLNLTLNDGAPVDEGGAGAGEAIRRRGVAGPVTITIAQTMAKGQAFPVENVSDAYTLVVTEEYADGGEIEPNHMEVDANALAPAREVRGYLDARGDVDLLRWTGDRGTYSVVVLGDGLPLQWRVGEGPPRTPGVAKIELERGDLIRIERTSREAPLIGRDLPWSIMISP